jgi:type IV pilus assembly protein PilF
VRKNWLSLLTVGVLTSAVLLGGCAANRTGESKEELPTNSDQADYQKRARIRLQLAVGYYEQRQLEVALDEIKQALAADPNLSDAYNMRGLIYMGMSENRLAEENFLHAIRLAPNNPDLSNNYGWFLCQSGRPTQSIAYFDATLKHRAYQSPVKALNNAGVCSLKLQDQAGAERYFMKAFQLEPDNFATNVNLARLYYDRRDYEQARFYVARVTKAGVMSADVLWLAIKTEHKLGDRNAEANFATQLRRRHPNSPEYAFFQRGAFDE